MTSRWEQTLAWSCVIVVVAGLAAGLLFLPVVLPEESIPARLLAIAFAITGAIAVRKRQGRVVGWVMIGIGLSSILLDTAYSYAELLTADSRTSPAAEWVWWFGDLMGQVSAVLMFVMLPLLFPSGQVASPRWRWVLRGAIALAVISTTAIAFAPTTYENAADVVVGANPLGAGEVLDSVASVSVFLLLGVALLAIVGFVLRFRRSAGVERLQMRWLATGFGFAALLVIGMFLIAGLSRLTGGRLDVPEIVLDLTFGVAMLFIPFGAGVAVTRYRLYDIDRVISRTATYLVVITVLASVYIGAVLGLGSLAQTLFGTGSNDLVVAVSTLLVAAAFQPVRSSVRARVDRRFNRARVDAAREVERFGARLRDRVALDEVVGETVGAAGRTVQPAGISLWVRSGGPL